MIKFVKFFITGLGFGIILTKSEVISWFRIQEMFRFESIHMYGVIGLAILFGIIFVQIIKRFHLKSTEGLEIEIPEKTKSFPRYLIGGTIFGLGWAMTGACPGPLYALLGYGYTVIIVTIGGAVTGTAVYGLIRNKLPH